MTQLANHGSITGPGIVGKHSARIWLRARVNGPHTLTLRGTSGGFESKASWQLQPSRAADGATSICYPDDFESARALPSASVIHYSIHDTQGLLGAGRFETAPEDESELESEFSIAVFSCHQPFDESGKVRELSQRVLERLPDALRQYNVKRILGLGDQMYADCPQERSLYNQDFFERSRRSDPGEIAACNGDCCPTPSMGRIPMPGSTLG